MRSSLAGHIAKQPLSREELRPMRAAAWHGQALATMYLDEIRDDFVRQGVINEMNRMFGRRDERPMTGDVR